MVVAQKCGSNGNAINLHQSSSIYSCKWCCRLYTAGFELAAQ